MKTDRTKTAALFLFVFALYFLTRSPGLDDADSVQFAMGVNDFDLWRHRPHAPGYPLYVLFGWLARGLFGWSPEFSLHVASCLGGALFVAVWFAIVRKQFGEAFAWLIAVTLAITPIVWMTATKVLTDAPAVGLLSVELFFALLYKEDGRKRDLILTALIGAAATGVRPQLVVIAIIVLAIALWRRPVRDWLAGIGIFFASSFLWLIPMWYLQCKLRPELSWWRVYPGLLWQQWRWRLDKPFAFIGADLSLASILDRLNWHILGWFRMGLGFGISMVFLIAGFLLTLGGLAIYFFQRPKRDVVFWRTQLCWAVPHIAIVFCFLPWEQRYYMLIFPLLLIAMTLGFFRLPDAWKLLALSWPLLLGALAIPLAITNHREEAPPLRLVRHLQSLYPPEQRHDVLLLLRFSSRHAQWYAPEFPARFDLNSLVAVAASDLSSAKAIYADDPDLVVEPDFRLERVATFGRSIFISPKLAFVELYQVVPAKPDVRVACRTQ